MLMPMMAPAQEGTARAPRADDEVAIVKTLGQMFSARQHGDLDRFHAATTKDFYAYDNGKRFDGDALAFCEIVEYAQVLALERRERFFRDTSMTDRALVHENRL